MVTAARVLIRTTSPAPGNPVRRPGPTPAQMAAIREAAGLPPELGPHASALIRHAWEAAWADAGAAHSPAAVYLLPADPDTAAQFITWVGVTYPGAIMVRPALDPAAELVAAALVVDAEIVDDGEPG
jgi:hypothetical protein